MFEYFIFENARIDFHIQQVLDKIKCIRWAM